MAQKNKKKLKTLYYKSFEGERVGESQGFYEIVKGKLKLVTCWSCNDADWRDEYMSGLIEYFGGQIERLPAKHEKAAEKLLEEAWGLDYDDEEEDEPKTKGKAVTEDAFRAELSYTKGTSNKVYNIYLEKDGWWQVRVEYGRHGGKLKTEFKCKGFDWKDAKEVYDHTLNEKLKKGYEAPTADEYDGQDDNEYDY